MDANTPIVSSVMQTAPRKCWSAILRLDNPFQSFFDKTWPPREIEPI